MSAGAPLLAIENLSVALPGGDRRLPVEEVSFTVAENEIVCLVGESGSGKSMTAHALLGLLPRGASIAQGCMLFRGRDLARLDEAAMRKLRGAEIAMIFQEPLSALNPLHRVGKQIAESLAIHAEPRARRAQRERVEALLSTVGLADPSVLARSYPFQLSGGQRQRVMIAMALANNPALLLADEPTTALDVTTQKQIIELLRRLQRERRMGVLFITHDFGVVAEIADRIVVMRNGRIVEQGVAARVLAAPADPYTQALVAAVPGRHPGRPAAAASEPLLTIEKLQKTFVTRQGLLKAPRRVVAAENIDLAIGVGDTVALVGESGSGKSTLGRMILRLAEPDGGTIRFGGADVLALRGTALHAYRRSVQIIFQDPFASLNPRQKVGDAIARGPIAFGVPRKEALATARRLLGRVGLDAGAMGRFPHEFSGGQRQRIAIARALAVGPRLLVADEAVSALDVSVQAQVLALLAELKAEFRLAMLFITHDLRVAAEIADTIVVMRHGRIVERGSAAQIFAAPREAYTRELLAAVPGQALFAHAAQAVPPEPKLHYSEAP
jgi:peptide/nickel transport system ATP-binding protein